MFYPQVGAFGCGRNFGRDTFLDLLRVLDLVVASDLAGIFNAVISVGVRYRHSPGFK
jgi:hypothetical protein